MVRVSTKAKRQTDGNPGFLTLSDLEQSARRRVRPSTWSFLEGIAGEGRTFPANHQAFLQYTLQPRAMADIAEVDTSTTLLGTKVSTPFFICPMAGQGLVDSKAEKPVARAAARANLLGVYPFFSKCSMEQIAETIDKVSPTCPKWLQLYVLPDFEITRDIVRRAELAGYSAIVLTVNDPVHGVRDGQILSHFGIPRNLHAGNLERYLNRPSKMIDQSRGFPVTWNIFNRIQNLTKLPIVLKGIMVEEEAEQAVEHGARGIIVSNMGGRQLDGAPATLDALPNVLKGARDRIEVFLDGGVRRGSDIVTALALGAKAVGIGRPVLWGLAAGGEAGVAKAIRLLQEDLRVTMRLLGIGLVKEIDESTVTKVVRQ